MQKSPTAHRACSADVAPAWQIFETEAAVLGDLAFTFLTMGQKAQIEVVKSGKVIDALPLAHLLKACSNTITLGREVDRSAEHPTSPELMLACMLYKKSCIFTVLVQRHPHRPPLL